ncbi:hypothetical protein AKO1_007611 [Acrasis kona]|uniref:Uncharacterized protein n=1 Tax=Acrasis kona TaxID=1008807 RepID=A0AAW2YQ11_9EUKA
MILTADNEDSVRAIRENNLTSRKRNTVAERRASQAKIQSEQAVKQNNATTTIATDTKLNMTISKQDYNIVIPKINCEQKKATVVEPTNEKKTTIHQAYDVHRQVRRSYTPSPRKNSQLDSPSTSSVIKRLVSRCCMLQKIKSRFEDCVRQCDHDWGMATGSEHLPWALDSDMFQFSSQPSRLNQVGSNLNQLITIENEAVNILEEVIELTCACIRKYSKKYSHAHCENLTSKQFFKKVVNSVSFKNSLNLKLAHVQQETFNHHHQEEEENDVEMEELEGLLSSGKLQFELRSKLMDSSCLIFDEIQHCQHALMTHINKERMEDLYSQLKNIMHKHKVIISTLQCEHSEHSSTSFSSDVELFEMDEESDMSKIYERQQREDLEEERLLKYKFPGIVYRPPRYQMLFY